MERIQIIGCSGAGKSTLARTLGEKTGLPVIHGDRLFWKSGWVESTREEIDRKILDAVKEERWIFDGNYMRTLPRRLERCDLVIWLDFPAWFCLYRVCKRYVCNLGRVRPDMPQGCPEKIDWDFVKWVWDFNRTKGPKLRRLLQTLPEDKVVILKSPRQVRLFLKQFQ